MVAEGYVFWLIILLVFWLLPIWIIALSAWRATRELTHIARTLYFGPEHEHEVHRKVLVKRAGKPSSVPERIANSMFGR
jgi:ABC-type glycerol-3-phosphate transport system permease component